MVVPSISELTNVKGFRPSLLSCDSKVIVIDEGNTKLRGKNSVLLSELPHEYYGPRERKEWFKKRFGSSYRKYLSVIPARCHAESSFGFLVAYEEVPDVVIEIDDDVCPVEGHDIVDLHWKNLTSDDGVCVISGNKRYNTLENLQKNTNVRAFPRGHPYAFRPRKEDYMWVNRGGSCVLNMGLWAGCPDLDALTILYHSGLHGRCHISGRGIKKEKIIIGKGTYFALCSMNTAFKPKIVPAFYQLYMNFMGTDRFDDIWSGLFFKKVADHLGERVSIGRPLVYHDKRPRDTFNDLKKELEGMIINEKLWIIVDEMEIDGKTYFDAYLSLIDCLSHQVTQAFSNMMHQKFIGMQLKKMTLWSKIIDKLS